MPELIGHLITKYLRRHPFEGVSFFFATLPARKGGLFLAEAVIMLIAAKKKPYFMADCLSLKKVDSLQAK